VAAVDTNVLIDLLACLGDAGRTARDTLETVRAREGLLIAPVVYAELLAYPGRVEGELDAFLSATRVAVTWDIPSTAWRQAGIAYREYAVRRARSGGGIPRRIVADFLIGAHALTVDSLVTRDPEFYPTNFSALRVIVPT
jgi:predicted nucleic acid-binding protein